MCDYCFFAFFLMIMPIIKQITAGMIKHTALAMTKI